MGFLLFAFRHHERCHENDIPELHGLIATIFEERGTRQFEICRPDDGGGAFQAMFADDPVLIGPEVSEMDFTLVVLDAPTKMG
jgi:hypothetical protein